MSTKKRYLTGWTLPHIHLLLVVDGVAVGDVELQHVHHVLKQKQKKELQDYCRFIRSSLNITISFVSVFYCFLV